MFVSIGKEYPPPLTREDETATMLKVEAGDASARTVMILHNMGLVVKLASKYVNARYTLEDLISVGTIGLIKAVDTFKPSLGYRFSTLAARCIHNQILMYFRKEKRRWPVSISLDATLFGDGDGSPIELNSILSTDADLVSQSIERDADKAMLKECMNQLTEKQRNILNLRYGSNRTQTEISRQLGLSQSYVSRLEKGAIQCLRKSMSDMGMEIYGYEDHEARY